jgi:hypothetical protein
MNPTDPRLPPALEAAMQQIRTTTATVASRLCDSLGTTASTTTHIATRDAVNLAQDELRRSLDLFGRTFFEAFRDKVAQDLLLRTDARRKQAPTNWQSLSLVNDSEVEERMTFERIGQTISHACEWQLRELAAYMGTVTGSGRADEDRNPLRAEVLGAALYRGIEAVSENADSRKVLARSFGLAMAEAMPDCYAEILRSLQQRGVQPVELSVRTVEGPGHQLAGYNSGYSSLTQSARVSTRGGQIDTGAAFGPSDPMQEARRGAPVHDALAAMTGGGGPSYGTGYGGAPTGYGGTRSGVPSGPGHARTGYQPTNTGPLENRGGGRYRTSSPADAQLMTLLRRLTAVASEAGEFNAAPESHTLSATVSGPGSRLGTPPGTNFGDPTGLGAGVEQAGNQAPGLMAVNLIKAHREELMQASTGKLDHMVIEVVGSLFDQILSDARVPPQMARQIARLQLPVLRVAMNDATFFSTRRHPVRRFINRIASLACAFDDFGDGPGRQFLAQVASLVQEIVDGDFDQIDLYAAKLAELEGFIAEQTHVAAEQTGAVSTLAAKESELRIQQRYMLQLQAALAPLNLPPYLGNFLPQVWSQALVLATRHDGANSDRAQRFRRVGRDLVMSIQPKGSPMLRKKFLMQLPPLMKDLNEGMQLIGWPEAAQRELLGKLLPAHAESLKSPPLSELDFNMMAKQLEGIFNAPIPGTDSVSSVADLPEVDDAAIEHRFTPEEAAKVGLVQESAVDWDGHVDIDLSIEEPAESTAGSASAPITLDTGAPALIGPISESGEPAEPTKGPQLIDHIQLGFAYQMHLKNEWQKVRLAHVSSGRGFFLFTRGAKHQETISMTSRMLARMCETGRMRAVESAYLMERATHRARKQLASLKTPSRH